MEAKAAKERMSMPNKTSESQLLSSKRYNEKTLKRIPLDINLNTMQDIIERFEEVPSRSGYIFSLVRRDLYRTTNNYLVIQGTDITADTAMKHAALISEHMAEIRAQADAEWLSRIESMYREDTPEWVIVAEYLRSTTTDPIIIE